MNNLCSGKPVSFSQTIKAVRLRDSRAKRRNQRMFNNPLRVFLEHKYPTIFSEYSDLYQTMRTAHPRRNKLETSATFRQWMRNNPVPANTIPQQPCLDILTQAIQETFNQTTSQNNSQDVQPEQCIDPSSEEPVQNSQDVQTEQHNPPQDEYDIHAQADAIIDEILANEDLVNIMEQPNSNEDEGIELNLLDEIYGDIESFDYALEVEPFQF